MRKYFLAVGVFVFGGCGFLFVEGPPRFIPDNATSVRCTDSKVLPTLDLVWMGLNAIAVGEIITSGVAWIIISGISAIVGQNKVKACREAKDMVAARAPNP